MTDSVRTPNPPDRRRRLLTSVAGLVVLIAIVVAAVWLSESGGDGAAKQAVATSTSSVAGTGASSKAPNTTAPKKSTPGKTPKPTSRTATPSAQVPARVTRTLALIDAGRWPDEATPGTKGGTNFGNFEGRLPATGAHGQRLRFTEWDVNAKQPGRGRDAERIITADDGSAWYTLDHYRTFIKIRGPSA